MVFININSDFDANQDSPVELLHVALLGVVKYWWRDAVSRLTSDQKAILKTHLSSFEVSGISADSAQLQGHTLVQYAGSLVGRDFRLILQVAPAVLYDLLPKTIYEAWLSLCRLAPLLYQLEINDLATYLVCYHWKLYLSARFVDTFIAEIRRGCRRFSCFYCSMDDSMVQQTKVPFVSAYSVAYSSLWASHTIHHGNI